MSASKPMIIGITGGSGSGKTHFLKMLTHRLGNEKVVLISMDNYYLPKEEQKKDGNGIENFDLPESIDRTRFHKDLTKICKGESITFTEYNFNHRAIKGKQITLHSAPVIIVEGIYSFYYDEIADLLDLKLFIDTADYLMLKRRIVRDASERGYDLTDVLYRFQNHVIPSFHKYILPLKEKSDLIIPNHDDLQKAVDVIVAFIRQNSN